MLNILPVFSEFHNNDEIKNLITNFHNKFKEKNLKINIIEHSQEKPDAFLILTGGTESFVLKMLTDIKEPVIMLCHSNNNSFPASLEILARLNQLNKKGKIIYLSEKENTYSELNKTLKILEVKEKLKNSKIGIIGTPSDWLVASMTEGKTITSTWGPSVIEIPFIELAEEIKSVSNDEAKKETSLFITSGIKVIEPDYDSIITAAKVYFAFKKISKKYNLNALTVRCFDLVKKMNTSGCYGMSKLTDEGIIGGCEGDLPSTLTMLWMYYLTGELPFMANPQEIDTDENLLWIAHCTVARKLLKNYIIRSHFESSSGVAIEGEMDKGDITLARIGGKDLKNIFISHGEIIDNEKSESRCRTQLKLRLDEKVDYFLKNPLGNHHVIVRGSWSNLMKEYEKFYCF